MNQITVSPNYNSDRFIPLRKELNWQIKMNLSDDKVKYEPPNISNQSIEKEVLYKCLLKNELIGTKIYDLKINSTSCDILSNSPTNLFTYSSPSSSLKTPPVTNSMYSASSQKLLKYSGISSRYKISVQPYKILDAPELADDYYRNLIDWSCKNQICTALNSSIYLWCADKEEVVQFCDLDYDVTSLAFNENGTMLAFATQLGLVQVWDIESRCRIREFKSFNHTVHTYAIVWKDDMVISGGSGSTIVKHDMRDHKRYPPAQKLVGHTDNVCGLKLSNSKQFLASGGNDNLVFVWDERSTQHIHKFTSHTSAVKALAWSSQQNNVLCTGGGAHDKTIKVWNIQSGKQLNEINTGSQVCNLTWSKYSNDFLSTHGSLSNQIYVWSYPRLNCVAQLSGHASRVLYLAASPCGKNVATAGGEELRLWHVFNKGKISKAKKSVLELFGNIK